MHPTVFTVGPAVSPNEDRFSARLSVDGTASADGRSSPVLLSWLWVRRCSPPGLQRRQAEGKMSTVHWLFLLPAWKGFDFWRDSALHSDSASQEGTCEQAVVGCHKGEHQISPLPPAPFWEGSYLCTFTSSGHQSCFCLFHCLLPLSKCLWCLHRHSCA